MTSRSISSELISFSNCTDTGTPCFLFFRRADKGGTLERSLGRQLLAHEEYRAAVIVLSRAFLNYFYFFSPRFAVLRPAFACPFGQLSLPAPPFARVLV